MLKNKLLLPILFVIVIISMPFLIVLQGQTNKETVKLKPTPVKLEETLSDIRDAFPIVEYSSESLSRDEKQKSKKYDAGLGVLSSNTDISRDLEAVLALDWDKGLTALPTDESEVVILGKVIEAKAHLSSKKNSVYSEFKIEIENVFKNKSQQVFENGKCIRAEREGGIVQYPSGYKFWYRIPRQQMPRIDRKYIFFLTNNFPIYGYYKEDFYLLTAYELKEGRIFPLDNPDDSHPIVSTYKGKDEAILINDLQNLLKPNK